MDQDFRNQITNDTNSALSNARRFYSSMGNPQTTAGNTSAFAGVEPPGVNGLSNVKYLCEELCNNLIFLCHIFYLQQDLIFSKAFDLHSHAIEENGAKYVYSRSFYHPAEGNNDVQIFNCKWFKPRNYTIITERMSE